MIVAAVIIPYAVPHFATNVVYDADLTLNAMFILLIFENYKATLISLLERKKRETTSILGCTSLNSFSFPQELTISAHST